MKLASVMLPMAFTSPSDASGRTSPLTTDRASGNRTSEAASHPSQTSQKGSQLSDGMQEILGKDTFLRLLTTQLRYQDPLNPIDDQDFIAQMAQFSALEQMQNLTAEIQRFTDQQMATGRLAQATTLLGKTVEVTSATGTIKGTVHAIVLDDGQPQLAIGDMTYDLADVTAIMS